MRAFDTVITKLAEVEKFLGDEKRNSLDNEAEVDKHIANLKELEVQLAKQREKIAARLTDDDILEFVGRVFNGSIGEEIHEDKLHILIEQGKDRITNKIPPGYLDIGKADPIDPLA